MMEWVQLVSAFGLGALAVKVLDIVWLQRVMNEQQRATWLRDRRLEAFSDVTREFISFGLHQPGRVPSPFESYGAVARALLLIEDDALTKRIDRFVVDLNRMNSLTDSKVAEQSVPAKALYDSLVSESRAITAQLRGLLLQPGGPKNWVP